MDSGGSSRRSGSGSGSGSRGRSPRLERRNEAKHIDYEAGGPTSVSASWSSSASASASSTERSPGVRPSRSLDLAARGGGGTDFRISRSAEGLCRSLGLSGPEDFAIPVAAWEARKARSSNDLLSRARQDVRTTSAPEGPWPAPLSFPDPIPEESIHSSATDSVEELTVAAPAESPKPTPVAPLAEHVAGLSLISPRRGGGEVGIRGVRPPLLSPPPPITGLAPPPVRRPSVAAIVSGSAWDIVNSFGPREENNTELRMFYQHVESPHVSDTEADEADA